MRLRELRPGLHRWTALHPGWEPHPANGSPTDWPREVGCVAYDGLDRAELRQALRPLLDLPVELVLASHGEPVLVDGHAALAHPLDA